MTQTPVAQPPIPAAVIPDFAPDRWLFQLFSPLAVATGAPLHLDTADVQANMGRDRLLHEAKLRGYGVVEEKDRYTLILNRPHLPAMI